MKSTRVLGKERAESQGEGCSAIMLKRTQRGNKYKLYENYRNHGTKFNIYLRN